MSTIELIGAEWGVATTAAVASINLPAHNVVAGDDIVIATLGRKATAPTAVTPSDGVNTYTVVPGTTISNSTILLQLWRARALTTAAITIQLTPAGGNSGMCGSAWEFRGLMNPTTSLHDLGISASSGGGNSAAVSIGPSGTSTWPFELVFAAAGDSGTPGSFSAQTFTPATTRTTGTLWGATTSTCYLQVSWQIMGNAPSTEKFTATASTTTLWNAALATFEPMVSSAPIHAVLVPADDGVPSIIPVEGGVRRLGAGPAPPPTFPAQPGIRVTGVSWAA